jgi:hypothetical protein
MQHLIISSTSAFFILWFSLKLGNLSNTHFLNNSFNKHLLSTCPRCWDSARGWKVRCLYPPAAHRETGSKQNKWWCKQDLSQCQKLKLWIITCSVTQTFLYEGLFYDTSLELKSLPDSVTLGLIKSLYFSELVSSQRSRSHIYLLYSVILRSN